MAEPPESSLPPPVLEKLRELNAELAEGDITQKGYEKKRAKLLGPYLSRDLNVASPSSPNMNDHYSAVQRSEALQAALAKRLTVTQDPDMPAPFKRQSLMRRKPVENGTQPQLHGGFGSVSSQDSIGNLPPSDYTPPGSLSSHTSIPRAGSEEFPAPPSDMFFQHRHSSGSFPPVTPPPDLTRQAPADKFTDTKGSRVMHMSSVRTIDEDDGQVSVSSSRVSTKIQQLLNTLKRPKRKPLEQFYTEDDDELLEATKPDPNAPRPEGQTLRPVTGESLQVAEDLPKNLEESVSKFATKSPKVSCFSVVDSHGKTNVSLTYGKLLSRSMKLAYALLNKIGSHKEGTSIMTGDRVALVYHVDDPINFMTSFYGCLIAGIIPVPIEPPASKDYPGCQQIGFLLGSCGVSWALTSETCLKSLPKDDTGHVTTFKGWPKLQWFVTANLNRHPKDWQPPSNLDRSSPAYIESTVGKDGAVMGVTVTRMSMNLHTQVLSQACSYTEGEIMISVLDPKREVGLWHSMLNSVMNGMHVIYVPPSVLKNSPAMWLQMVTKHRATCALVSSRDLHWSLHASKDVKDINLSTIRMLLLADRANPWSLSACDSFLNAFEAKGLKPEALCPCASSTETMTVALRRPGKPGTTATGRGVLSLLGLSHGVVRVDKEGSLTSLTLQDCGTVLPGAKIAVVKLEGPPYLCKSDEVGELCISSGATGSAYWGLAGKTNHTFKVQPTLDDGAPWEQYPISDFVRTGLLGFLGPGGLVFVCGTADGIIKVSGRRHNCDDLKATILAVDPIKFVYRGRIAIFSVNVLKDDRIVVVAEQRPQCTEEESFQWMSHVLPAVDSIHNVGIYCLCLVTPGGLPKTSSGAVHIHETRQKFLEGALHPANILMCPHTCVTNLPQPRQKHPEPGPAATMVGNIVMGTRIGGAAGREIADVEEDSDMARKYQFLGEILKWRAQTMADHTLFTLLNAKGTVASLLTTSQLHKRAERVAQMAVEQGRLSSGDNVALLFTPGVDFIVAVFACLYAGLIPVPVRPPHANNISSTLPTVKMVIDVSKSRAVLTTHNIAKALRSKEAVGVVDIKSWPTVVEVDDAPKKKLTNPYRAPTPEMIAYLDFSVSTTGMLSGVKMSHSSVTALCRSMKLACELYPSRDIAVCLDPYCGLGFLLWCLTGVYSGHHTILIPPGDLETNPALWLSVVSQYKVRDTFCSYPVMDLCTKGLGQSIPALKSKGVNLTCVRNCVVVAEERPRINLTTAFSTLFSGLGLSPRAVSTSFGCRGNVAICTQGASTPEASSVYVDTKALRNDRVTLVERGSPHSLCLLESGKILPGVKVVIANPETKGMCADSHLGEIWVNSPHNGSGYFMTGEDSHTEDRFNAKLTTGGLGETGVAYARTGYLGFIKRTDFTQTDGARHDALFVVGPLEETMILRGMRYHPVDIENTVTRCHRAICESAVFTWTNLLVVVVELDAEESEALDVVPLVTSSVLNEQQLIVGVVVVVDPGVVPINSRGEKQRMHLRDGFLGDQLDPIYVAEATCCEGKARSYEIGVSAAAGIAIGTSAVGFEGYNKWSGDGKHCEFKYGQLQEVCGGLALGLGIDMTVANGWWKDADSTKGQSSFAGATLCFGICFGGEYVVDTSFSQIGWVISSGLGFGGDISAGHCNAWTLWEQKAWQWNLQGKCPAGGCFPSDAQVTTPSGVKTMRELKAGDRVLTADSKGKLIFDEVYFFGHAEEKLAPYVKLQLQRLQSSSAAPESLELSPDHYVHVCLESGTCELTKAKTMYASDVTVGNHVWLCTLDVGSCELGEVISTSMVPRMGLYNPFTLSGNIVVNGVLASAHSSWFLDGLFSAKLRGFLPSIYQTILLPGRCLYGIFGSRAADWLGVNNPQWAQGASQWPAVLAVFGPIPILLCAGLLALRRSHSKLG